MSAFDEERMVAVQDAIARAVADGDASAFAELYTEDGMLLPPDGSVISGRDAIRTAFASMIETGFRKQTVLWSRLTVDTASAIEEGQAAAEFHGPDGADVQRCNYLIVHRQGDDGAWRMERDIWTAIPAGAPEPRVP
ncbi:MAG: SgcJ/EcaC family oxidoreductase [Solirubrobacteraceae bacterium]